jgi:hypothetical protein
MHLIVRKSHNNTVAFVLFLVLGFLFGGVFYSFSVVFLYFSIFDIIGSSKVFANESYVFFNKKNIAFDKVVGVEYEGFICKKLVIKTGNRNYLIADGWRYRTSDILLLYNYLDGII